MGYELPFTTTIADIYIEQFSSIYDSVKNNAEKIRTELATEEGKFSKTLKDGVREFEKIVNFIRLEQGDIDQINASSQSYDLDKR